MTKATGVTPKVSVIVPTFRRFESLVRTLSDLLVQDYDSFEIIVVDQNPEWPEALEQQRRSFQHHPRVRWIVLDTPGAVRATNLGASRASGDILLFVDDDVFIPDRGLIRRHVNRFSDERVSAVVGRERQVGDPDLTKVTQGPLSETLQAPEGWSLVQQALWFDRNGDRAQWICTFCTCNGAIRRSAFEAVNGLDESFAGHSYGYDYDLALRLHAAGYRLLYDPAAWLIHRRIPAGGLRMTDQKTRVNHVRTAQGLWTFVLRHGHRGMYRHLVVHHVLRKTVLLKRNLTRPWRQPAVAAGVLIGLLRARAGARH